MRVNPRRADRIGRSLECGQKVRYPDAEAAKGALVALRRLTPDNPTHTIPHRAYPCDTCSGWHLSSHEG